MGIELALQKVYGSTPTDLTHYVKVCLVDSQTGTPLEVYDSAGFIKKTVDFTASQTAQAVWTPTTGMRFNIVGWVLSISTAGAITVFDNSDTTANRIFKYDLPAQSGANISFPKPLVSSAVNNVLSYTTTTAVGSLTVFGYETT